MKNMAQMQSDGTSTLIQHHGFQTDSMVRQWKKDSVNLWVHFGTHMHSMYLYAEIDQFDPTKYTLDYDKLSVMDKWLLSKMNSMVKAVDDNLGNYRIPEAARALDDFVDEMSELVCKTFKRKILGKGYATG